MKNQIITLQHPLFRVNHKNLGFCKAWSAAVHSSTGAKNRLLLEAECQTDLYPHSQLRNGNTAARIIVIRIPARDPDLPAAGQVYHVSA
jgi:hypothetical protein